MALAIASASCTPRQIDLIPGGTGARSYEWSIEVTTAIDSTHEQSTRTIESTARVDEVVRNGVHTITLIPTKFIEEGVEVELPDPSKLVYRENRAGGVGEILFAPISIDQLELNTFLSQIALPLPSAPVGINDSWSAPLVVKSADTRVELNGLAVLDSFELESARRLARIKLTRSGRLSTRQQIGNISLLLRGNNETHIENLFDIDEGATFSVESSSRTVFDLSIGGAGSAGGMTVEIRSQLQGL